MHLIRNSSALYAPPQAQWVVNKGQMTARACRNGRRRNVSFSPTESRAPGNDRSACGEDHCKTFDVVLRKPTLESGIWGPLSDRLKLPA